MKRVLIVALCAGCQLRQPAPDVVVTDPAASNVMVHPELIDVWVSVTNAVPVETEPVPIIATNYPALDVPEDDDAPAIVIMVGDEVWRFTPKGRVE